MEKDIGERHEGNIIQRFLMQIMHVRTKKWGKTIISFSKWRINTTKNQL